MKNKFKFKFTVAWSWLMVLWSFTSMLLILTESGYSRTNLILYLISSVMYWVHCSFRK